MCMHQRFRHASSWMGPARQRSRQTHAAGCCFTTSQHTSASWVRRALSILHRAHLQHVIAAMLTWSIVLLSTGRLTKAAVPVPLLHGRSLGPICILTTLTHMQTLAAPVSLCSCQLPSCQPLQCRQCTRMPIAHRCTTMSRQYTASHITLCRKLPLRSRWCCWADRMRCTSAAAHWRGGLPSCRPLHARLMPRQAASRMPPGI